jgi:alpha-ketoglutarate-dependent taurine dioxygenase
MNNTDLGKIKASLDAKDYFECFTSEEEFISLSDSIGKPIPSRKNSGLIDKLLPKSRIDAHPNSLSNIHGAERFPFHTDGAYLDCPPKYMVLRYCAGVENPTPTEILPFVSKLSNENILILKREMWAVRGRNRNFYTSILTSSPSKSDLILRYDNGCMKPIEQTSFFEHLITISLNERIFINWQPGKTLFLNNWRALHARPQVKSDEINTRTLQRILVNEH